MNPEYTIVDMSHAVHINVEDKYRITWNPTQAELTQCEQNGQMYVVLSRVAENTENALQRLQLAPSSHCVIFYVMPHVPDVEAEDWIRDRFNLLMRESMKPWFAPAGLVHSCLVKTPVCCVCGTTEGLHKDGEYGYRCDKDECVCL